MRGVMNCGRDEVERAGKYVALSRGAAAPHGRHAFMADSLHGGPSAPQAGMDADGAGGCACFLGCPFRQELSKTGANLKGLETALSHVPLGHCAME